MIQINIPEKKFHETLSPLLMWNNAWEAGQFRPEICYRDMPKKFKKLIPPGERNIYFIPKYMGHSYGKYALLHHLLPLEVIFKFGFPFVENANWPIPAAFPDRRIFDESYDAKLQKAFGNYIWRFLGPRGSGFKFTLR